MWDAFESPIKGYITVHLSSDGAPVLINTDNIDTIMKPDTPRDEFEKGMVGTGFHQLMVTETPEEICHMIEEARRAG